jgi:uncharacterized protein
VKAKWIDKKIKYDGSQLRPLFNYLDQGLLGDSVVAFCGPCDVSTQHMVDGEDLIAGAKICGSNMLHFLFEVFDCDLTAAVLLQRLFASIVGETVEDMAKQKLKRDGDDLYLGKKKFSISIAAPAVNSRLIHFAVNVSNKGTPVETVSLEDFSIEPKAFAEKVMKKISSEYLSVVQARQKVRPVTDS